MFVHLSATNVIITKKQSLNERATDFVVVENMKFYHVVQHKAYQYVIYVNCRMDAGLTVYKLMQGTQHYENHSFKVT